MAYQFRHPQLERINGCRVTQDLIQFRSLPYARIPRRFARSVLLNYFPQVDVDVNAEYCYYAEDYGPCSIQPLDSIATDIRWNQLPEHPGRAQAQSEDCLRLTLTCPARALRPDADAKGLPVVVFVHGGALMIGSGTFFLALPMIAA